MASSICINDTLTDDELRPILSKLDNDKDKEIVGLVCKRWLRLQSTERKKLAARAGPQMLQKMAARFSCLIELDLSQSISRSFYPGVTDYDLAVIANGFKCLRVLNLQNCKGISDSGMQSIGCGLSSLRSLEVSYCRKLTDKGFSSVAEGCRDLESLHLAGCRFVTDGVLKSLSKNCPNLQELGLQGCTNITDHGLTDLVSGCQRIQNLEALDIGCCEEVTDAVFQGLGTVETKLRLKVLKVSNCPKVTVTGIGMLLEKCNTLEYLEVRSCPHVTKSGFDEAGLQFPECCKVNYTVSLNEPDVLV
ncbi:hypothetical protein GH714_036950 [Hevea brasiliensis]|uniref:F-box/LRR-repeat protein 15-like leucin rich repeat domain-containing protein n=1 Tax=Hevea brasiliensis TaxID=3981 RepID=A0A6A6NFA8_HEVBR|nr:hypothetical protein GH714_036950 [Hevea brasiliensis]